LLIPPGAQEDPKAMEVIRIWVAKGGQHVSLNPLVWKDPQAWGIVLADLAGHVANAYEQALGLDRGETMRKITDLLLAGLPTQPTVRAARCRIPDLAIAEDEEIKALRASLHCSEKKIKKYRSSMKRFGPFPHYSTG
jgi:hypothetical protein